MRTVSFQFGQPQVRASVFPAGPPREGEYVLQWITPNMSEPVNWYFATREEAEQEKSRLAGAG